MKKLLSLTVMLMLLVTTFLISGCLPPNYSKEQAKKIAQEHRQEALNWFATNMPNAKPDSDVEAYETGTDLYGAVKGNYKRDGKSHKFVYEYTDKKMYIDEGYEETCKIIEATVLKDFGYTKDESVVSFHGYKFKAKNENDNPRKNRFQDNAVPPKALYSYQEKLIPADKTPEQFAKAILAPNTEENFDFYIHLYRDNFPEQQLEKQKRYQNLRSIWCSTKIDLTKQPQGIYEKVYLTDKITDRYYHIEKINDGLYAGYISFTGFPAKGDKLKIDYKEGKHLTLTIPEGAKPIIFSKNSMNLVQYFKNTKGDTIHNIAEELFKTSIPGVKGYHQYSTELFVKDNLSYGYSHLTVPLVKGVYTYKILGIFDLDYWKLKFFD